MNWADFFTKNAQPLFTLGGVFLGSLITFLISYLNNRFQAKERDKDRLEQRREAKAQLALDLMSNDIKSVETTLGTVFEVLNALKLIRTKRLAGLLSENETKDELRSMLTNEKSKFYKLAEVDTTTEMLVYTFGEEFYLEYQNIGMLLNEYMDFLLNSPSFEDEIPIDLKLVSSTGKLHSMLREKLISLRDI